MFLIVYYRLAGVIASIAVTGLISITLLIMSAMGITLTLPGIAGIILSIGMGVDANVVIFERIKEEIKNGKTIGASVDEGFKRAFKAILDSNITTILTAAVLYWLGSGPIRGFAITLIMGVTLSFLTGVTATRLMLKSIVGTRITNPRMMCGA